MVFVSLLFVFLLFLSSCVSFSGWPGQGGGTGGGASGEDSVSRADEAYNRGEYALATRLYSEYLAANPGSPRREALLAAAGLSAERAGSYSKAIGDYGTLMRDYPTGSYAKEAAERLGQVYLAAGRAGDALLAARNNLRGLNSGARYAAQKIIEGKALYMKGDYEEAAEAFLSSMSGADASMRADAEKGLYASFLYLSQERLNAVAMRYGQNFPGPEAVWFMAYQSALKGDAATFKAQVEYFKSYFPSHAWAGSLDSLAEGRALQSVPGAGFDPASYAAGSGTPPKTSESANIGSVDGVKRGLVVLAVLPMTVDNNARFSQEVLAGLKLALAPVSSKLEVRVLDTEGKASFARRLIGEASEDPNVIAAVGPINSSEALSAAQISQEVGLPLIAVSTRMGLTSGRPYVFRVFLMPKLQAEAVARYSILDSGHKNLAILYPDDAYGKTMLSLFESEVARLGGTLAAKDTYNFAEGTYKDAADRISGGKSVRRASVGYQAQVNYSAIYVPDSPAAVSLIAAQMAFNDLTKLQYLGAPYWYVPELILSAGRYLQGSVIPVPYSPLSLRPEAQRFGEAYKASTGNEPSQFSVYGYDAGIAILSALSTGASTRPALLNALNSRQGFPGASGPFSFDADGDFSVTPVLLTVKGSSFILLKDATRGGGY
jgi:branched-chain amino acid transport system substrate-binding protein